MIKIKRIPEHLNVFSKSWKFSNQEHHLYPGEEAAQGGQVPLPQVHGEVVEGVAVEGYQGGGHAEEDVHVRIKLQQILLWCFVEF